MIIVKAIANPSTLPLINAALFHSTPFLTMKKRVYWPQRSDSRGPPKLRFKLVSKKLEYLGFISNYYDNQNEGIGELRVKKIKILPPNIILKFVETITIFQSAMKWHPDHHQGVDKALAEATFKKINAAHESLCNELSGP